MRYLSVTYQNIKIELKSHTNNLINSNWDNLYLPYTGRPNYEAHPRNCVKLFAEVEPKQGQPVSANFEVNMSYNHSLTIYWDYIDLRNLKSIWYFMWYPYNSYLGMLQRECV